MVERVQDLYQDKDNFMREIHSLENRLLEEEYI